MDVSDHAVLRWIERVDGVDLSAIRVEMRKAAISPSTWRPAESAAYSSAQVLGYLRRARGFDFEAIRKKIAALSHAAFEVGAAHLILPGGVTVIFGTHGVQTIYGPRQKHGYRTAKMNTRGRERGGRGRPQLPTELD